MSKSLKDHEIGRIVVVDSNIFIQEVMGQVLQDLFLVVTVRTAEEALEIVRTEGPFEIVISSFGLAGMNGLEFLRRVGEQSPKTVRILMTGGCGDEIDVSQAISEGHITRVVLKPFCIFTLREQLKSDLEPDRTIEGAN